MKRLRSALGCALVLAVGFAWTPSVSADPASPENPSGYAEVVSFGAQEDHDLYPGPGNVIGDVRSDIASGGGGTGVSNFVDLVRTATDSKPSPSGLD